MHFCHFEARMSFWHCWGCNSLLMFHLKWT